MALITCPHCGAEIIAGSAFCSSCGKPARDASISDDCVNSLPEENSQESSDFSHPSRKPFSKRGKWIFAAAIAVLLIAIGSVVGTFLQRDVAEEKKTYLLSYYTAATCLEKGCFFASDGCYTNISFWEDFDREFLDLNPTFDWYVADKGELQNDYIFISRLMNQLKDPLPEYEDAYQKLDELYQDFLHLADLYLNPPDFYELYVSLCDQASDSYQKHVEALHPFLDNIEDEIEVDLFPSELPTPLR